MKILIACEYSGIVRDAFTRHGHYALSCDLLPCESLVNGLHYQGDVFNIINKNWDLMIAHPPCTYLCSAGARWKYEKPNWSHNQELALEFVKKLLNANIPKICLENPVGIISTQIRKPDQYIQPWQFGHGETKKTGLWLKNLPLLTPTKIVNGRENRIHKMPPSPNRGKLRSRFYTGIAEAMVQQWG